MRAFFVGLALALFAARAWGDGVLLPLTAADAAAFTPLSVVPDAGQGSGRMGSPANGWLVRVDRRRLFQVIHAAARNGSGRLVLKVADDLAFDVVVERTKRTLSGHSLSGRLEGVAGSAVTFAAQAEVVMGTVWTPQAAYEMVPLKDGVHVFREVDRSARPRLSEPVRAEGGWGELRPVEQAAEDGESTVDVLVLWTPRALQNAGGEAQMRTGIDLAVAWANDAYERSGAEVRLNLVGAEQVDYVEAGGGSEPDSDTSLDLDRLANPSDGFMDGAHTRRDALGADLVSLLTGVGNFSGIALLPGSFTVVGAYEDWSSYGVGSVFAHELGHNMGLSHDRYLVLGAGDEGLLPFSYGYVNKLAFQPNAAQEDCWLTIMSYHNRCTEAGFGGWSTVVPYFSTPDLLYPDDEGAPLGVPKSSDEPGADGPADAVYALNLTLPQVVAFSSKSTDDGDTAATATPVTATSTTLAALTGANDIDYFRIELPEAGWLRAETTGNGNQRGALTSEDGELIAEDDDSGDGYNFLIEAELQAGVYFIKVDAPPGWNNPTDYKLVVSFNPASAEDDHGDGAAQATVAATPSTTAGELHNPSDTDYFRFEVAERGLMRVGTVGATDVVGTLISEDGAIRLTDDDSGTTTNFLIVAKLDPGVYFVAVTGFDDDATGPYSLDISFSPLSDAPDDHADSLDGATELEVGSSASGELEVALDRDLFRIEVPGSGPGQLLVKSTGDTDVKGALLAQDGGLLNESGLPGSDPNFAVGAQVAPGTYILRVAGASAAEVGRYAVEASFTADSRSMPLFIAAANPRQQGFARIINRGRRSGAVTIHAIDDAGRRHGPVTLSLAAGQTAHFNSDDLEMGNADKGLSGGVGAGEGDWRLELATDLDIEALAYVRTTDGFLTDMNALAPVADGRHRVAFFNPASNDQQVGKLRLINPADAPATITISGVDDAGAAPPEGEVTLTVPAGASAEITAQQLEAGADHFKGQFGDGKGKWRLFVKADQDIQVMSLLESPTGHITNLSSRTAVY